MEKLGEFCVHVEPEFGSSWNTNVWYKVSSNMGIYSLQPVVEEFRVTVCTYPDPFAVPTLWVCVQVQVFWSVIEKTEVPTFRLLLTVNCVCPPNVCVVCWFSPS
jgi:hypothetical protein